MGAQLQGLLQLARTMKWSISVGLESDPAFAQTQQILDKFLQLSQILISI